MNTQDASPDEATGAHDARVRAALTWWVTLSLNHRWLALGVLLFVTLGAASVYPSAELRSSLKGLFFGEDHPEYVAYEQRVTQFGSDAALLVAVETTNPLGAVSLPVLEAVQRDLEAMPEVRRVTSVVNMERTGLVGDTIAVRRFAREAAADPTRAGPLLDEVMADPAAGGRLVSRDGQAATFVIELDQEDGKRAEDTPRIVAAATAAATRAGAAEDAVHTAGVPAAIAAIVGESADNLFKLFPAVVLLLLGSTYLLFGRIWPVFVTSISALLAVAWAMAFAIFRDPHVNIFISLIPCLVLIISVSDVVHLCSAYLLELEGDTPKRDAILAASVEVGEACLLTSVTTSVGFASLMLVPTPVFQQLGAAACFGVLAAYGIAMTLVPILFELMPRPAPWRGGRGGRAQAALDAALAWCDRVTSQQPWPIIAAFAACFVLFIYGSLQITFEAEFAARLSEDSRLRQDQAFFQRKFASTTAIDLYVEVDEPGGLLAPERFNALAAIEAELEARDDVDSVLSIVDLTQATYSSIVPPGHDKPLIPASAEAIAQLFVMLEMQGPDAMGDIIDFDRRATRFTILTSAPGIRAQDRLAREAEAIAAARVPDARVDAMGLEQLIGAWIDRILEGQKRGLGASLAVIALLMMLGLKSLRVGALSMIPNLLPLLAVGGYCGLVWDTVDTDTLVVAMIAIGIGVDDTIHFLSRYRAESARHASDPDALHATFSFSGRGIVITTVIFTVGFLPLAASDYVPIRVMGALMPYAFVVALVADLLLVPAMVRVGLLSYRRGERA